MHAPASDQAIPPLETQTTSGIGILRIAIGLIQAALLYWLHGAAQPPQSWPAIERQLFTPLLFVCALVPPLITSAVGHMRVRPLLLWTACAAVILATLGWHGAWRTLPRGVLGASEHGPLLPVFSVILMFIAHSLVLGAAQQQRRIAPYAVYFEVSWKLFIQASFSALFVGAMWAALMLGSQLFMLVKVSFLQDLVKHTWFNIPITAAAFAWALHITDVRPAIVRGIRTLLLVLMSWVLPLATLIVGGFLLMLPFTGLTVLWKTGYATLVLLLADGLLILLINAAYQNGEVGTTIARIVRASARVAATLLVPITGIAIHALSLRVGEHGWSGDRVIAAACLLVGSCYALGYLVAALRRAGWLDLIAQVNVAAAFVVLAVLLALFTPIADPARISVNSQLARLDKGRVAAADFDFTYLRQHGGRYGDEALRRLQTLSTGADAALIRERATLALESFRPGTPMESTDVDVNANFKVWPAGATLPASFPTRGWRRGPMAGLLPKCLTQKTQTCHVVLVNLSGDATQEVLLVGEGQRAEGAVLGEDGKGNWTMLGMLPHNLAQCDAFVDSMKNGTFQIVEPGTRDIAIGGQRIGLELTMRSKPDRCKAIEQARAGTATGSTAPAPGGGEIGPAPGPGAAPLPR